MKRFLLTLAVLMASITAAFAEVLSGSCGANVTYTLDTSTGVLTIQGTGAMSDYYHKSDTYVTTAPWGDYYQTLKSVTISQGVTNIGNYAFLCCSSLTSITIPEGVTSIGNYAFDGCSSLTSITIPVGVTSIRDWTFYGCSSLTSVTIPEGVTSIGGYAFESCSSLTSVIIPESVTSIGNDAFSRCSSLTSITIPSSVTSIGRRAFQFCRSLTSITIPSSVTSIGDSAFDDCSSLTSITISEGVTSIGSGAFSRCSSLTSITIPSSVTSIGNSAFSVCYCLSTNVHNNTSFNLEDYDLTIVDEEQPDGLLIKDNVAIFCRRWATSITIPESVTSIGGGAFGNCSSLTSITIPSSVTSIGNSAFYNCSSLTSITIPKSVTSIEEYAFRYCSSLTSVTIPVGVTSISDWTFYGCSSLTSITIPESVTSIGSYAFYGCSSLTSITIPSSVTSIRYGAFQNCSSLALVELLGDVSGGGSSTFPCNKYIVPEKYYSHYRSSLSGKSVFPKNEICFTSTPTLKEFKAEMAKHDKSKITSITFACDNLDEYLDEDIIKNGMNPNCVYYVPEGCAVTGDNFVEIGNGSVTCNRLSLTDGYPFACIPIECEEVVYVHHPSVWANGKSGWETLCLPFSPTSIRASESGYLSPIVLGGNGNFWLRKYVGSSSTSVFFTSTADGVIEANTPYLVAFPGQTMGAGHLEGETITFSASNVTIDASTDPEPIKKNAFAFKANYDGIPEGVQGYELNAEGSSFVQSATVGTKPFQAYFTNDELAAGSSVKSLRIDFGTFNDETGIFEVEEGSGMQPGSAGTFYDLSGRRISQGSAQQKGIYISNGRKVIKLSK